MDNRMGQNVMVKSQMLLKVTSKRMLWRAVDNRNLKGHGALKRSQCDSQYVPFNGGFRPNIAENPLSMRGQSFMWRL